MQRTPHGPRRFLALLALTSLLTTGFLPLLDASASASGSGRGIGVSPSRVDFGDVSRGKSTVHFMEVQTTLDGPAQITFQRSGELAHWIKVPADPMTIQPHTRERIPITLDVPANATNGNHQGRFTVLLLPADGTDPTHVRVQTGVTLPVTATVHGEQARLIGHVRSSAGHLVPGVLVSTWGPAGGGSAQTDAEGRYELVMKPGDYSLEARTGPTHTGAPLNPARMTCNTVFSSPCIRLTEGQVLWVNLTLVTAPVIRGYVVTEAGEPIPRMEVLAWGDNGGSSVQTTADGFYEAVVKPGAYSMNIGPAWNHSGPSYDPARLECTSGTSSNCILVAPGESVWQNFTLRKGSTTIGRVLDTHGRPVAAALHAETTTLPRHTGWGTTDPRTGEFSIQLSPGTYTLRVVPDGKLAPGLSGKTVKDVLVQQGEETLVPDVVLSRGSRILGYVKAPDGTVLPGASIFLRATSAANGVTAGFAATNDASYYEIPSVAPDTYDLSIEPAPSSGVMPIEVRSVKAETGRDTWINLTAPASGRISGYVLSVEKQPIAGAKVEVTWTAPKSEATGSAPPPTLGARGHATTDLNGHYTIPRLAEGTFHMFIEPPAGTAYRAQSLDDGLEVGPGATTWSNVTLTQGGALTGRIVTPQGNPVAAAWVNVFSPEASFGGAAPTDARGVFHVTGIYPSTYHVEVTPPAQSAYSRTTQRDLTISGGSTTDAGNLTLRAATSITGTVVTPTGAPVANAWVSAFPITRGDAAGAFTLTDAQGTYALRGLIAGTYSLQVDPRGAPGLSAKSVPSLQVPEKGLSNLRVTLESGGYATGRVVDSSGAGVADAAVGLWSATAQTGDGGHTDANGNFKISGLPPATDYTLDVTPPTSRSDLAAKHRSAITVQTGAITHTGPTVLPLGGAVAGRIVDATGRGVAFTLVNLASGKSFVYTMTDTSGNFAAAGIQAAPGDAVQILMEPGHLSFLPTRATVTWAPNATGVTDAGTLAVTEGSTARGHVTRGGLPVADAEISLLPSLDGSGSRPAGAHGASSTTGSTGWFNVTGFDVGTYDVAIRPRDGSAGTLARQALVVSASGSVAWFNTTLGEGAHLRALVRDATGAPIPDAQVEVRNATLSAGGGNRTDGTGSTALSGLPTGTYDLKVKAPGHATHRAPLHLTAGALTEVTIDLTAAPTRTLTGIFLNEVTGRVSGYLAIAVPARDANANTGFAVTAQDGGFTLKDLSATTYHVKILTLDNQVLGCASADLTPSTPTGFRIEYGRVCTDG